MRFFPPCLHTCPGQWVRQTGRGAGRDTGSVYLRARRPNARLRRPAVAPFATRGVFFAGSGVWSPAMRRLAATLLLSVSGCGCVAPQHPAATGRTEQHDLESAVVGDTYRLWVRLPPDYDASPARRYPLVVQLDANLAVLEEFDVTAGYASDLERRGDIPPTVVVGVGYPYDPALPKKGRQRDYSLPMQHPNPFEGMTGGGPTFYEFLRAELLPYLERTYRVDGPAGRALFGHSLGGLFTTWAVTQHDAAAPVFSAYVAASPALFHDQGGIYAYLDALAARTASLPVALSMTAGELEGPEMTVYFDDFTRRLADGGFQGLALDAHTYDTDHLGTVAPSFRDGLRFAFQQGLGGAP